MGYDFSLEIPYNVHYLWANKALLTFYTKQMNPLQYLLAFTQLKKKWIVVITRSKWLISKIKF